MRAETDPGVREGGVRVLGRVHTARGWQIQLALPAPKPTEELPGAAYDFDRDVLGRPWKVSIDERTGLPVALSAGEPGMRPYQARWRAMTEAERSRRIAWIHGDGAASPTASVRKTVILRADARDVTSLNRARDRIYADVIAWQSAASRSSLSDLMRP
jgi:hypothetical protein